MSDTTSGPTLEELVARKEKLEKAALSAIDKGKDNLFEVAARKLEPVYAAIDEHKAAD